MDKVIRPKERKWIGATVHIGREIRALLEWKKTIDNYSKRGGGRGGGGAVDKDKKEIRKSRTQHEGNFNIKQEVMDVEYGDIVDPVAAGQFFELVHVKPQPEQKYMEHYEPDKPWEDLEILPFQPTLPLAKLMHLSESLKSGPKWLLHNESRHSFFLQQAYKQKIKEEEAIDYENAPAIMNAMNKTDKASHERLKRRCSLVNGTVPGEANRSTPVPAGIQRPVVIPPVPEFDTLKLKSVSMLMCSTNPTEAIWRSRNSKQVVDDSIKYQSLQKSKNLRDLDYVFRHPGVLEEADGIIKVSVYEGRICGHSSPTDVKVAGEPKLLYTLALLARNTVADLRNAIKCKNGLTAALSVGSPDDHMRHEEIMEKKSPCSVICIHGSIYSDGADSFHADINNWVERTPKKKIGPFKKGDSSTRLEDLTVQLGYPYVFIHMNCCEHIIVFNSIRLPIDTDEHHRGRYPYIIQSPGIKQVLCRVDAENLASWVVLDFPDFPESTTFLCTFCLKKCCYEEDGEKRGPFELYPFRQFTI